MIIPLRLFSRLFVTILFLSIFLLLCSSFSFSEQFAQELDQQSSKSFGDYEIHYSVFNSTFITPPVAKAYQIIRGKNRALVNIAVTKKLGKGKTKTQTAVVTGTTYDLIHKKPLEFKQVTEQNSIYYIAEFEFNDKELLAFTINVQPDANFSPYTIKFNKTLYFEE